MPAKPDASQSTAANTARSCSGSPRPPALASLPTSEEELLPAARGGDADAIRAVLRPHLEALRRYARRLVRHADGADDLSQEVLVRACRSFSGFRGESSVRTWLLRIATRLANEPRRFGHDPRASSLSFEVPDSWGPAPDAKTLQRELRERLDEAMERLPPRQRTALHLRAVEGLDYAAIADVLDCRSGAARMLVLSARRAIMDRLGRYLEP